ncbi:hypothetical protein [Sulfurimonas sp. HSL-1716]|uniref:hypothetical protein n=1 Tax=Hydrocurvibacter sulfurireducens TaxID=3131937 RepID=UPI0031F99879
MNMQGLSLEQAPPYRIPLLFYIVGAVYLLGFSIAVLLYAPHIDNRYYLQAIAVTHIMTLGFFTHIIFGTLFQMMPVIISEAYKNVNLNAQILLIVLNIGILGFLGYFLFNIESSAYVSIVLLSGSFIYFALYSLGTVLRTEDKNEVVKSFIAVFLFLIIGALFGALAFLQHMGMLGALKFGDIHFTVMIFGVVFMLFAAVVYKIIPMFYVTQEYPSSVKNGLFLVLSLILLSIVFATLFEYVTALKIFKTLLGILIIGFSVLTVNLLRKRKRARSDITVNLFYFSSVNLAIGGLLWIITVLFDLQADLIFGVVLGLGFVFALINGMIYKIVPFLTWFHLSSKYIYEAEMGEVIKAKMIRIQYYVFMASYGFFMAALLFKPLIVAAAGLFFVSSSLLLYNIVHGYNYYSRIIKKAPDYGTK